MLKITFFFLVAVGLCYGISNNEETGGERINDRFLYMASLRSSSNNHFCGGFIISNRTILTAASCLKGHNPKSTIAVVGTYSLKYGGVRYQAEKLIIHPKYNKTSIANDIAMMIVNRTIEFTYDIQPIKMENDEIGDGVNVYIAGWGVTSVYGGLSDKLQVLRLETTTVEQCKTAHADLNNVLENQVCAIVTPGGACYGDGGGPLVIRSNKKVAGILSWGFKCAEGKPDVFTRISSFSKWINANKV